MYVLFPFNNNNKRKYLFGRFSFFFSFGWFSDDTHGRGWKYSVKNHIDHSVPWNFESKFSISFIFANILLLHDSRLLCTSYQAHSVTVKPPHTAFFTYLNFLKKLHNWMRYYPRERGNDLSCAYIRWTKICKVKSPYVINIMQTSEI